ncbi:unnamed protein product, partial [Didymodactylos carnosus]
DKAEKLGRFLGWKECYSLLSHCDYELVEERLHSIHELLLSATTIKKNEQSNEGIFDGPRVGIFNSKTGMVSTSAYNDDDDESENEAISISELGMDMEADKENANTTPEQNHDVTLDNSSSLNEIVLQLSSDSAAAPLPPIATILTNNIGLTFSPISPASCMSPPLQLPASVSTWMNQSSSPEIALSTPQLIFVPRNDNDPSNVIPSLAPMHVSTAASSSINSPNSTTQQQTEEQMDETVSIKTVTTSAVSPTNVSDGIDAISNTVKTKRK